MKNTFLNKFNKRVKIKLTGKNVNNYLKRIVNKYEITNLRYNSYNECTFIINYNDYLSLKEIRSIYDINIINTYGILKIKKILKKTYILIITLILALLLIIFLSNVIFSIEVVHTNKDIINLVSKELSKNNIKKYTIKKDYNEIEEIEEKILNDNKDALEWIEIDRVGTKYIVRVEERKINNNNSNNEIQDIVASKSGVIKKIIAYSGEKNYEVNNYVNKGDIIIKGSVTKPNNEIIYMHASGLVYAEVWYEVSVEYPYHYKEEILTGNKKTIYYINFINKKIELFNFKKYKNLKKDSNVLLKNSLLPISFVKEKQYEVNVIDEIYTTEEVINKAISLAEEKLLSQNKKIEKIENVSVLKKEEYDSKIRLNLFISVIEEISEVKINDE